jgi:hypothetical protein
MRYSLPIAVCRPTVDCRTISILKMNISRRINVYGIDSGAAKDGKLVAKTSERKKKLREIDRMDGWIVAFKTLTEASRFTLINRFYPENDRTPELI